MTEEQERKLDRLLELAPILEALGDVVVRRKTLVNRLDLNKNALNQTPGFEEIGRLKTYIEIGEIEAVRKRRRNAKRGR